MKLKHPLLLAMACAGAAPAIGAEVTLWGIGEAAVRKTSGMDAKSVPNQGGSTGVISGVKNISRWAIRVREDLGGGLKALAELEAGIALDQGTSANASKAFDRASYVGLEGRLGRVTLGRQTNLLADAVVPTDPLGARFAAFNPNIQFSGLSAHGLGKDYGNGGSTSSAYRLDNSVKLTGRFGGFTAQAMTSFGERTDSFRAGGSVGVGGGWSGGPVVVTAAYSQLREPGNLALDAGVIGAAYKLGTWRFSGTLFRGNAERSASTETRDRLWSFGVSKAITSSIDLITSVAKLERSTTGQADAGFTRFMAFGEYKFSKRTVGFVEFDSTKWVAAMRGSGKARGTGYSVGLSHRF
jgi:predicted porin